VGSSLPPSPGDVAEGATLAGKYRLVRELGAGGMCVVWEAEHLGLGSSVAVKVLKSDLAKDKDCVERFEREAKAAAQLQSANVARVIDVDWLPSGVPYITMELLIGHDLGKELAQVRRLPVETAVDYVRQACNGIAEAHALGIVHRDVKPENLFLTDLGSLTDRKLVKLLDFGIAKTLSDEARRLTAPDAVFGTVDYMSPEQIRSASTVDHRSDLWSLGVILYELITGRTPYAGDARSVIAQIVSDPVKPPTAFIPDLSPQLVAVIMKALAKDRELRYQSAQELGNALKPFSELETITNVVAMLPPGSLPRRTSTKPPRMPESVRDARTHASWESLPPKRGISRAWLFSVVAIVFLVGTIGVLLRLGGGERFGTVAAPPASPPPPVASAIPATASADPAPPQLAATNDPSPQASTTSTPARPARTVKRPPRQPPPRGDSPKPPPLPDHL